MPSLLFSDSDLLDLRTLYPYLDLKPLSPQLERFVISLLRGAAAPAAARMAGMDVKDAERWLVTEEANILISHYREQIRSTVKVDVDRLSMMLLDAHDVAATAGERVSAIRELGQLHNLYPQKQGITINNNTQTNNTLVMNNSKRLERMSDDDLLAIAQLPALEPSPLVIEGECTREPETIRQKTDTDHCRTLPGRT